MNFSCAGEFLARVRLAEAAMPPPVPAPPPLCKALNWHDVTEGPSTSGINESCPFKAAAFTYAEAWWLRIGEPVSTFLGCHGEPSAECFLNDIVSVYRRVCLNLPPIGAGMALSCTIESHCACEEGFHGSQWECAESALATPAMVTFGVFLTLLRPQMRERFWEP